MEIYTIEDIQTDADKFKKFIEYLNKYKGSSLDNLYKKVREKVPELNKYKEDDLKTCNTDKGKEGKYIEYCIFGNKPNSISAPDCPELNIEIKVTKFKTLKNGSYNAKERLTISNVGSTNNYETFRDLKDNENIENTKFFKKMEKILLIVLNKENNTFLGGVFINYNELESSLKTQIIDDYNDIRNKIDTKSVSQKGQKYLHIHPHGTKKEDGIRAVGFKNPFITEIFAKQMNYEIIKKGRSCYFNIPKKKNKLLLKLIKINSINLQYNSKHKVHK